MTTLSAGYDFLGKLGNDLRDLSGLDTLIFELVQNADDATGATRMRFDVTDAALIVWNDGVFSECDTPNARECGDSTNGSGRSRCDFHSFRRISGQAKREKTGTTGAFGIGFTSVFQVSDYPELISSSRHWKLRYDESEDERIRVCDGCERDHGAPGTEFVLPWARDEDSPVREGLRSGAVKPEVEARFIEEALRSVSAAMVFLRRLRLIELCVNGSVRASFTRSDDGPWRSLQGVAAEQFLYVLDGSIEDDARTLRTRYTSVLGSDVRESIVNIAIPTEEPSERLPLHAVLPTRETSPLGFRLSSSFYPFQDRKRLKFEGEGDAESEWNRAAVRAGARLLASALAVLPNDLGAERLWSLLGSAHWVANYIEDAPDEVFASFWSELCEAIPGARVVWTAYEQWATPGDVYLIEERWQAAVEALQELGVDVVHVAIADQVRAVANDIGVTTLNADELASAIREVGLTAKTPMTELPGALSTAKGLDSLLRVVADLIEELDVDPDSRIEAFDQCGIIPCLDGTVGPPAEISAEDEATVRLFQNLPGLTFVDVDRLDRIHPRLKRLLWPLLASEVVNALEEAAEDDKLQVAVAPSAAPHVLRWIAERSDDLGAPDIATLRRLRLFPSAGGLLPLEDLELPGAFTSEPLGISNTVDLRHIEDLRGFLGESCLGARTLNLDVYIHDRLAPRFAQGAAFEDEALDKLLYVLADKLDDLDDRAIGVLADLPLITTSGRGRTSASHAYFDTEIVRAVLGRSPIVSVTDKGLRKLKPLFEELGVSADPRPEDVVTRVQALTSKPKTRDRARAIRTIIEHLGPRFKFGRDDEREQRRAALYEDYGELFDLAWIPVADRDDWGEPGTLYRTDWRTAFASTGSFVDLHEKTVQQPNADLLELLGIRLRPEPELVVAHLLGSVERNEPVARRVYEALDSAAPEDLEELIDSRCILVSTSPVTYAAPSEVVRDPGPLLKYLRRFPNQLASFHDLATSLAIADEPGSRHAIQILRTIADQHPGEGIASSSDEYAAIQACWRILEREREHLGQDGLPDDLEALDELIRDELADTPCWRDKEGILRRPGELLIDDLPSLRQHMPDEALRLLVDRPRWGVGASSVAGLRPLSEALQEEVVRVANGREHTVCMKLFRSRRDAIARVLFDGDLPVEVLDRLGAVEVHEVDEILLHRAIDHPAFDLGEHSARAFMAASRLYVKAGDDLPWTEVAVAIARYLCGRQFSSGIASSIERVLTAASAPAAHDALDALDISRLEDDVQAELGSDEPTDRLFDDELDESNRQLDSAEPTDDEVSDEPVAVPEGEEEAPDAGVDPEVSVSDSAEPPDHATSSTETGGATPVEPSSGSGSGSGSPVGGNGSSPVVVVRKPRAQSSQVDSQEPPWRVWVSGGKGRRQESSAENEANAGLRMEVSRRGVELVLLYEKEHGRFATEMRVNNPGYDVESRREPGRPATRLIEVKALAGTWEAEWANAGRPPQMTAEQFRQSRDGNHWLYVVESVLDKDNWRVYPIQAVGQRTNRYLFDHGWKEAADHPWGPGLEASQPHRAADTPLPERSLALFGSDERDVGDIPFLSWSHVHLFERANLAEWCEEWFTSPVDVAEGDFAVQQIESAMGPTLPFGAIAVFRRLTDTFPDDAVVLAQVAGDDEDARHVIRRARLVRDDQGQVEGLHLRVDVPGRGDEYEFHDPYAGGRVLASLVAYQEL